MVSQEWNTEFHSHLPPAYQHKIHSTQYLRKSKSKVYMYGGEITEIEDMHNKEQLTLQKGCPTHT